MNSSNPSSHDKKGDIAPAPEKKSIGSAQSDIPSELVEIVENVLDREGVGLTREKLEEISVEIAQLTFMFAGPLPPPSMTRQYETICPGFTDRNLKMVESRQQAQIDSAADERSRNDRYRQNGQYIAAAITALFVVVGAVLSYSHNPYVGLAAMFGGPIIGIVGLFVNGRPLLDGKTSSRNDES